MNTLFLCCCKCQLICAFFDLICYITIPVCATIAIAAIAKSPVWQQKIRSRYDYKIKMDGLNKKQKESEPHLQANEYNIHATVEPHNMN